MPKLITFKTPALDKGKIIYVEKTGYVVKLLVGDTLEKFVLQLGGIDNKPESLTHYASGQLVPGKLSEIKVRNLVRWGTCSSPMTDRAAAKALIEGIVDRVGADVVRSKFNAAPVINR